MRGHDINVLLSLQDDNERLPATARPAANTRGSTGSGPKSAWHVFAALLTLLLVLGTGAWAQESRATLVGRVVDPSNAAVAGAKVVATEMNTNARRSATTTESGDYTIPFLAPGPYRVEVEQPGFRKFVREGIILRVQDRLTVDVALEIGAQTESVTVTGAPPLLETSSASTGQVVAGQTIQDLPLNGRAAFVLMTTTPGVTITTKDNTVSFMRYSAAGETGGIALMSISGAPSAYNEYLVDGVPITSDNNAVDWVPSIEATQEFKLQTNSFDAEFGRFLGGVVNTSLRSGTNDVHGTAFDFIRNSYWNSKDFFATYKPKFSYNQFGASLGAPAYIPGIYNGKNRTFFFVMYDGSREGVARSFVSSVPTALERAGDFSQTFVRVSGKAQQATIYDPDTTRLEGGAYVRTPFEENKIPAARLNTVAKNLVNYFPLPTVTGDSITHTSNYPFSFTDPVLDNGVVFKVDHQFNESSQMFVRYFWRHFAVRGGGTFMSTDPNRASTTGHVNRYTPGAALGYTHTLDPTTILDFRYGYSRYRAVIISDSYGIDLTSLGFPESFTKSIDVPVIPNVTATNYTGYGSYTLAKSVGDTHFFHVGVAKQKDIHSVRFGFNARVYRHNSGPGGASTGTYAFTNGWTLGPNPQVASTTTGNAIASMLLGLGGSGSVTYFSSLARQMPYYEMYLQDDIRLTSKLSVNVGIRYEWEGEFTERYNRLNRGYDFSAASPIESAAVAAYALNPIDQVAAAHFKAKGGLLFTGVGGQPRSLQDIDRNNVSPRVGVVYTLTPKTVLRGGYGHFFGGSTPQYYTGQACASCDTTPNYGFSQTTTWVTAIGLTPVNTLSNPYPSGITLPAGSTGGLRTGLGTSIGFVNPKQQQPWTQQFSFGIQQQLPGELVIEAAYAGTRTKDYPITTALNFTPRDIQLAARQTYISTKRNILSDSVKNPFYGLISTGSLSYANTTRGQLVLQYPHFTGLSELGLNDGSMTYDSLQLKVNKRFGGGLTFLAAYTLSKMIGATGRLNSSDPEPTRSLTSYDSPQRLVLTGSYQMPFGKGKRYLSGSNAVVQKFVEGWQANMIYTAQSGVPITLASGESTGQSAYLPNGERTLERWFNTTPFRLRETLEFVGTSVLPDVRTHGFNNIDLSFFKDTAIYERLKLQFRAEAFNLANRVAFGSPNATVGSTSFGKITTQVNFSRQLQFSLKLLW